MNGAQFELYTDGQAYYTRPGGGTLLCWQRGEEGWNCERVDKTLQLSPARFDQVPADLREEILAFAARAAAIGGQTLGN
ncbi:MAG: hypothetical protein GKR89_01380 [Candidatus Latescibacteria bacterium]|nr:hypothetical protein [Candidatus Latescibacterota bacterium]